MRLRRHKMHTQANKRDQYCESFAWRNGLQFHIMFSKGFTLHITSIKPLCWYYMLHEVQTSLCSCLLIMVTLPTHYNKFFWNLVFVFFFVCFPHNRNSLESHTPTRELVQKQGWFYCGLLNIAKNHSLVYEIAFVAFNWDSEKCRHEHILDRCHSKTVKHLVIQKMNCGEKVRKMVIAGLSCFGI